MTSALRGREGGWSKRDDSTDRLREWDSDKGGGVQKSKNFANVILVSPLRSSMSSVKYGHSSHMKILLLWPFFTCSVKSLSKRLENPHIAHWYITANSAKTFSLALATPNLNFDSMAWLCNSLSVGCACLHGLGDVTMCSKPVPVEANCYLRRWPL